MTDVHDPLTRSKNMAAIRSQNTQPELIVRRLLHANGFRFRLNVKKLQGTPDLVFPKYKAVVFVHGCFWHRHGCQMFVWPQTRAEYWEKKLNDNVRRDAEAKKKLLSDWKVGVVWECAVVGRNALAPTVLASEITHWIQSDVLTCDISSVNG